MRKQKAEREARKAAKAAATKKAGVKRPVGGQGGNKSRYSSGVNTPEKRAADKKRKEEREASKKARIERSQAKGKRRGTGVKSKSTSEKKKKKSSNLRISRFADTTQWD